MLVSVYCSGSIMKGAGDERKLCWSDVERQEVAKGAAPHEIVFLNPDDPITDPRNTIGQFGRDMYQVMVADAVVVDARERRGIGIGVEMTVAGLLGTPVIVVAPKNSKYRTDRLEYRGTVVDDYIHPHVAALSAAVVDDFVGAGEQVAKIAVKASAEKKDSSAQVDAKNLPHWLENAITEYRKNLLHGDAPMLSALRRIGISGGLG